MHDCNSLTADVLSICRELGFALAGIARPEPTRWERELREWIAAGKHGEMAYLERFLDVLPDPRRIMPAARSIICVADRYASGGPEVHLPGGGPPGPPGPPGPGPRGRIARYARGDDYHIVIKRRLHALCDQLAQRLPDERFRACVDTAPVLEREHAQRAGLGAVGKHTLLIEPGMGSYLLLGEVLTTAPLEPTQSSESVDPCGSCTRCIDACPTDAITPWSVDATRCISYLTIEHRSAIDERYHDAIGDWIFGCDICQEVCPHNHPTRRSRAAPVGEAYSPRRDSLDLLEVLEWDEQARRETFIKSAMKRARLNMMKRNALIAAGNALRQRDEPAAAPGPAGLKERIEKIASDEGEDQVVRETAAAVLRRLASALQGSGPRGRG